MNHNKFNLQEGQKVRLDESHPNSSEVIIHAFTPSKLFSTVYDPEYPADKWQVMTNRLTEL